MADFLQYAHGENVSDTITNSIGSSDTSIAVNAISKWNTNGGAAIIDRGTSSQEIVIASGVSGSSLTISLRGAYGTSAVAHNPNAPIESVPFAHDWNNVITTLTNGFVKGTGALDTTKVTDLTTAQTLTNKTLTSPVLNTPSVGAAAGASPTGLGEMQYNSTTHTMEVGDGSATHTLADTDQSQTLTNKTITDSGSNVMAKSLKSATTTIDVSAATAPSSGQVLTATSSTTATWQTGVAGGFNSGFSVVGTANQTIATSSDTKMQFTSKLYDLNSEFDATTNYRFTATAAGKYLFVASAYIQSLATGNEMAIRIYKNGANYKDTYNQCAGGVDLIAQCTALVPLAVNDYVEFYVWQNNGSSKTLFAAAGYEPYTYAMGQRLV